MKKSILIFIFTLTSFFSSPVSAEQPPTNGDISIRASVQRNIAVRSYEIFQKRKLRIHLVVYESDGLGRFLLNTMDVKSFRLLSPEQNDLPVEPSSLSTFATRSPQSFRQTAIVFEAHQSLSQSYFDAIRSGVAGFLGGFRSDILSVRSSTAEKDLRLAWSAPGQSENPRAVQKSILESGRLDGHQGISAGICSAVDELTSDSNVNPTAQRNLIFIAGVAGDDESGWSKTKRCLEKAESNGSRIFWIRVHDQQIALGKADTEIEKIIEKSGGFLSYLGVSSDPMAAMNNLRSYLDDEYVLEFDLGEFRPYSDTLKFTLIANYHGNIYRTSEKEFEGFVASPRPEELERIEKIRMSELQKERRNQLILLLSVLAITGAVIYLRRRKSADCSKCGFRVSKSFQDCPFRNEKCEGRLSIVQGDGIGSEYPLFSGENTLGRASSNTIRLENKSVSRQHGKVMITKRKALFFPMKGSETRVNGVIATEPRLLSSGTILRFGEVVCRVDFKEGK